MKDILITSSVLILVLLFMRTIFRNYISARFQYALWGLVVLRLLMPVSLPAWDFSLLSAAAPVGEAISGRVNTYFRPEQETAFESAAPSRTKPLSGTVSGHNAAAGLSGDKPVKPAAGWNMTDLFLLVWRLGMGLMAAFFFLTNMAFWKKVKKYREPYRKELPFSAKRNVYTLPDGVLPSPCLFGGAVYLPEKTLLSNRSLRHVLCHEEMHARHFDTLWALLRALCLTVYWFDPLVWIAAVCSKNDCELACDESALAYLGEQERIPYGETLLSLIPVKTLGNPLLSVAAVTAGKRQLKERIRRIVQGRRQMIAAVFAVLLFTGIVSACTFAEGRTAGTPDNTKNGSVSPKPDAQTLSGHPEAEGSVPLSGKELQWFNENFFNGRNGGFHFRNQCANPSILYARPEEIDLFELFYIGIDSAEETVGGDVPSDEELSDQEIRDILKSDPENMACPAYKLTTSAINGCLRKYFGLSIEETEQKGMDNFTYASEYDAYYWMAGDTNYCGDLYFQCGTRENADNGSIVKLYQRNAADWYCVTLAADGDTSEYRFLSNQQCERPAIPTPMPENAAAMIPLADLAPYTAPEVVTENRPASDYDNSNYENQLAFWDFDGRLILAYRAKDGLTRVAEVMEDESYQVFLTMEEGQFESLFFYDDLLGQSGFYVEYTAPLEHGETDGLWPCRDYFYFDETGRITCLCRAFMTCFGGAFELDLAGDGTDELICSKGRAEGSDGNDVIFFEKDGQIYEADIRELVKDACPELTDWTSAVWDAYSKSCQITGLSRETDGTWERVLYFDGENLRVYPAAGA